MQVISWNPRIFMYRNFLSAAECDYILALRPEQPDTQKQADSTSDTKPGRFISAEHDKKLQEIELRIADWAMVPPEHGENFYLTTHATGNTDQARYDFFDVQSDNRHLAFGGQRILTFVVCLQAPEEGGETTFPLAKSTVPLAKGDALLVHNTLANGQNDPNTVRGSNTVTRGSKVLLTKWIRAQPYPHSWYLQGH
jgi:prolyl 4-hydroxylase